MAYDKRDFTIEKNNNEFDEETNINNNFESKSFISGSATTNHNVGTLSFQDEDIISKIYLKLRLYVRENSLPIFDKIKYDTLSYFIKDDLSG